MTLIRTVEMCNKALKSAYKSEVGHESSPQAKDAFRKAASEAAAYFEKYRSSVRSELPISFLKTTYRNRK